MTDNFDFDAQPSISRDQIYVSWNEAWPISRYIDDWLKTRRLRVDDTTRAHIQQSILRYSWTGPLRKADVDYYLDVSVNRSELELPQSMKTVRKSEG